MPVQFCIYIIILFSIMYLSIIMEKEGGHPEVRNRKEYPRMSL